MATDVSSFKDAYKTAIKADFPKTIELSLGDKTTKYQAVSIPLRYGTNPHQPRRDIFLETKSGIAEIIC